MGFPLLPQLSSVAELFVIDLVAHHNPQPDAKLSCRGDPRLAHPFLDELAPVEASQLRVFLYRMHHRFGPQIAQQRVAFLAHLSQSLPLAAGVFARDHPDVAGYFLATGESTWIPDKHLGRQRRHRAHARMSQQPTCLISLLSLLFHLPSSACPVSGVYPVGHVFASVSRPPGSSPDGRLDTLSPTRPVVPKTTAWIRSPRCPPRPDPPGQRRTRVLRFLHGRAFARSTHLCRCPPWQWTVALRVDIAAYNFHLGLLRPEPFWLVPQSLLGSSRGRPR